LGRNRSVLVQMTDKSNGSGWHGEEDLKREKARNKYWSWVRLLVKCSCGPYKEESPMKKCSYCGRENDFATLRCAECGTELSAEGIEVALPVPDKKTTCPNCGAVENFRATMRMKGSFSLLFFLLGGFLAVILRKASQERRVQCNACAAFFNIQTAGSKVSFVLLLLLVGLPLGFLLAGLVAMLLGSWK
jgi:hypothetical protein